MDKNKDNGFGFGTIAAWGANIGAFLTTNWIMAMSAAFGLLTAIWKWLTDLVAIPSVELAIFVFLAVLWTSIGITVLSDRRKARLVRTEPEYKYSLTFEGIVPKYNNTHPAAALQFGILFRNYSLGPIKYTIEVFEIIIDNRTLPKIGKGLLTGLMSRGAGRMSSNAPFKRNDIRDFIGRQVEGTIEFRIAYGHPERSPERQLKMKIQIFLTIDKVKGLSGYLDNIVSESDSPYVNHEG